MGFKTINGNKVFVENGSHRSAKSMEESTGIKLSPKIKNLKQKLNEEIIENFQNNPDDPNLELKHDIAQMKLDLAGQREFAKNEPDPVRRKELESFIPVLADTIKELEEDVRRSEA